MKKKIHPPYQDVLFVDSSVGYKLVCGSSLQPKQKETFEGKEYPVHHVSVSSASHPFFTGSKQLIDTEKRVDKFNKRYAKQEFQQKVVEPEAKEDKKKDDKKEEKKGKKKK